MVDNNQIQRADGSKATAYALSLASSELDGLDILTWPAYSPIWPTPGDTVRSEWFDLANHFRYFTSEFHSCLYDFRTPPLTSISLQSVHDPERSDQF